MLKVKQQRSRERRQQLLLAATKVVGEKGMHATTLTEISQVAGVPLSSIYNYFNNKTELLAAIPQANFDEFYEEIDEMLKVIDDPLEQLREFYLRTFDYIERNPTWGRFFFLEIWPSVLVTDKNIRASVDEYARRIINIIKTGIDRDILSKRNDPYLLMSSLLGGMTHSVAVWLLYDYPYELSEYGKKLFDLFLLSVIFE